MVPVLCFSSSNFSDSLGTLPRAPLPPPSASPPPPPPPIFFLPVPHRAALTLAPGSLFDSNGTANKMNGALDHSDQPDPDAIKMFVGQIPRSWSEKELKELFEPYGAVYQINVLRDRSQNPPQSKGTDRGERTRWGGGRARGGGQGARSGAPGARGWRGCPAPAGGRIARGSKPPPPPGCSGQAGSSPPARRTGGRACLGRGREERREGGAAGARGRPRLCAGA